ncbi:hypothetical protein WH47_12714 [Habropoda laboriosa]|uniref:Uncharacterized protein n=1 Tax=Habropoda laboriosa TaxID=597456 RepID=A0A0L7R4V7_9HYME|nr:hypothetical protein WH47_12714 [Habropoda laboriosa]
MITMTKRYFPYVNSERLLTIVKSLTLNDLKILYNKILQLNISLFQSDEIH